jgi:hypothetical protein
MIERNYTGRAEPTQLQTDILFEAAQEEERIERRLDEVMQMGNIDPRAVALARTKFQEAFMWVTRAVWPKGRIMLPEDPDPS